MSCVGPVMYQPYSSAAPPTHPAATPSLYSAVSSPVSPDHTHHTSTTHPPSSFHIQQGHQGPLSLKREIIEKQYKLETDPLAPTPTDPVVERRVGGPVGGPPQSRENITFPSPTRQGGHGGTGPGSVSGSCGTPGPRTPVTPRPDSQQDRDSDGEGDESGGRSAVYLSRNVILYTHYAGEVANIVDEHFSKALNQSPVSFQKKITPMASRNLPPSFFNAHYHARYPSGPSETSVGLYSDYSTTPGLHHHLAGVGSSLTGSPDPWQYAAQASASCSYHRSVQDLVNSATSSGQHYSPTNTANSIQAAQSRLQSQYSSLFLGASNSALSRPGGGMVSVKSETPWVGGGGVGQEYHTHPVPDFSHSIDRNYSPHHYPNMTPTGLEATGQEASKDLYWPTF